jgi:hypothetical protein
MVRLFTFSGANMQKRRATDDDNGIFQAVKTHVQSVLFRIGEESLDVKPDEKA